MVNEQSIPAGVFDTCETKVIFHLLEDDIGVSRKVIGHNKIGFGLYVVPRIHAGLATGAGQYFFCDGRAQNNAFKSISIDTNVRCLLPFKYLPQHP